MPSHGRLEKLIFEGIDKKWGEIDIDRRITGIV